MATRTLLGESEHDMVVRASAATYGELEGKGYKVSINPGGEKNTYVGSILCPCYPDVVVWKPDSIGSTVGTATIIEEIETAGSVNEVEAEQWLDYGKLGAKFILIVPNGYCAEALRLVSERNINVSELWYYWFKDGNVMFNKHI
jgi:hypothetical protein